MTTTTPAQQADHARLIAAVLDHTANDRPAPCLDPSAAWAWHTEDDEHATAHAAALCTTCPALDHCAAYITAHPEPAGVWAGTTPKQRRRNTR